MKYRFRILKEDMSNEYDSEGNQLTKKQAEFFKNSKIRDSRGRLLVCYHGTDSEFDEFVVGKIRKYPGFWFTADNDYASSYGTSTHAFYLNSRNPLNMEANGDKAWEILNYLFGNNTSEDKFWTKEFRDALIKLGYDCFMWEHSGYYTCVVLYPNQIKSITNKNPTNSNNINEDWDESFQKCRDILFNALERCSEGELINFINGQVFLNPPKNGPFFILPDGRYLKSKWGGKKATHNQQSLHMIEELYYHKIQNGSNISVYDWADSFYTFLYAVADLDIITAKLGWVRGNPGTSSVEYRLYFVIPNNATDKQLCAIRDSLDVFLEHHNEYQAFFIDENGKLTWHVEYPYYKTPDEFLKIMRNYINNGKKPLGERLKNLNEVYPNKGESKKDFISRFMSVTKNEYPDTKQRYAIANAYWNRRNKKRESIDEYFEEPPVDYHTGDVEGKDIFDRKTHTPFYDRILRHPEEAAEEENLKGEIVMMSPNEYYKECAEEIFNVPIDKLKEERRYNRDNLDYLKKLVTKYKRKMFMPYINYAERGQEGLHRMMVAGDLFGWDEKFPVLVVTTYDEERKKRKEKSNEEYEINRMFSKAVDRYRYPQESEEALEEKIRDYISDNYSVEYFKYYDPLNFTMWYRTDDKEYSGYDTCLVFAIDDNYEVEVDARDIKFYDDEEDYDDSLDDIDWDSPSWNEVDLDDPNLDIDALLRKTSKHD